MRVAFLGTRGVPARYGGFETAADEIGRRLAARGHQVTVYCRAGNVEGGLTSYAGMKLVTLPAVRTKCLETLSHSGVSVAHLLANRTRPDAVIMFNAGNALFLPPLRAGKIPVATHVDGLEWRRGKWAGPGRRYYRAFEGLAVRWSDALVADAVAIGDYYADQFGVRCEQIAYGAPILGETGDDKLARLGLTANGYHLVVSRFEPENHVLEIVTGYRGAKSNLPLVVVGSAPYSGEYTSAISEAADSDPRIRLLGAVWDQELLDQLYANALTCLHGHSVGGTNPSLLRAMGAATATIAWDVVFNSEVLGPQGLLFATAEQLARHVEAAEADPQATAARGAGLAERARQKYVWDEVATAYENLLGRLAAGESIHSQARNARRRWSQWPADLPGPVARGPLDDLAEQSAQTTGLTRNSSERVGSAARSVSTDANRNDEARRAVVVLELLPAQNSNAVDAAKIQAAPDRGQRLGGAGRNQPASSPHGDAGRATGRSGYDRMTVRERLDRDQAERLRARGRHDDDATLLDLGTGIGKHTHDRDKSPCPVDCDHVWHVNH